MDKIANLGIDLWSILIYLANTGLILFILTYFLYKPLLAFIDQRRKQIADSLEQARVLSEEFENKMVETKAEKEKVEAELKEELVKLRKYVEEKRAELTAEMTQVRADMLTQAQAEIDEKKARLIKDAEKEIMDLMKKIILDIVRNKVPEKVIQESIGDAWASYRR